MFHPRRNSAVSTAVGLRRFATRCRGVQFLCLFTLLCGLASAQTITSTLLGTVTDPTGAVVPGAQIEISNQATGAVRNTTADSAGLFRFLNLAPGTYQLNIKAPSFKSWILKEIAVSAAETRDVGRIALEIGSLTEQVVITAEATPVQVASSERSALVDSAQLKNLTLKGRDAFNFMQLLPGVLDTTDRNTIGTGGDGGISVNGNTTSMSNMVDGITDRDAGAASGVHFVPNMDAVAEVRLLASNYSAEYGRNSGGVVTMVTKSGGQDFHGSAWWVHRHEGFNANGYFNNLAGRAISPYRYNIFGWSVGGPVYIPGAFNKQKNRLFFFASQEFIRQFVPVSLQKRMMPTAAERAGDFSNSLDSKGNLIVIKDPLTGKQFTGNKIPADRINPIGQGFLNFLPLPNYTPAPGTSDYLNYNFTDNASYKRPVSDTVIRIDTYATSKLSGYFRLVQNEDRNDAIYQGIQWNQSTTNKGASMSQWHTNPGHGQSASVSYVFSPTTLNQFTFGHSMNNWTYVISDPSVLARSLIGTVPWLYPSKALTGLDDIPSINGMHAFFPSASFGGGSRPNPGGIGLGGYAGAYFNWNDIYVIQDNFSKVWGQHGLKAGIYLEKNLKTQPVNNNWSGAFAFDVDSLNPLNAGDGYANALLGNFTSYNESNARPLIQAAYWNFDFYVQDSWRVTSRLTLDLGLRMVHQESQYDRGGAFAVFQNSLYSAAKMPRMYVPYCDVTFSGTCPTGHRFAKDPGTSSVAPAAAIGLFVPGSGDPANGMQVLGTGNVSKYAYNMRTFAPGPRFGFAWDVLGNGKMSIRGGFGIMYDRLEGNQVYNMAGTPPSTYAPYIYYSNINSISGSASSGLIGPTGIGAALYGDVPFTRVQNASLTVQRAIPGGMVAEIGWVGNWGYNLNMTGGNMNSGVNGNNLNPVPLGARLTNIDSTNGKALPDNLLRVKYPGYGNLSRDILQGFSNYHGLQTQLQRRFSKGLMFGVSYTWSKSLGVTSYNSVLPDNTGFYYGPNSNYRKHIFAMNYSYNLPNLGKRYGNKLLGAFTDYWTLSGITTAQSGPPITPSCGSSTGAEITGSPNLIQRCLVVGDPMANVPAGRIYNPAAFALPQPGNIGNEGNNPITGTGYSNWDIVLRKVIPIGLGEGRVFKLELQAYNVFNQTQFNAWTTGANYSASSDASKLVTSNVGMPSATRPARILATSLRFEF
jgi:hypothetical protein